MDGQPRNPVACTANSYSHSESFISVLFTTTVLWLPFDIILMFYSFFRLQWNHSVSGKPRYFDWQKVCNVAHRIWDLVPLNTLNTNSSLDTGALCKLLYHTMKYQFEISLEKHDSRKNIFRSTLTGKSRERKRIDFPYCRFELPAN